MSPFASSSSTGFAQPPAPESVFERSLPGRYLGWVPVRVKKVGAGWRKEKRLKQRDRAPTRRLGLGCKMRYTAVRARDSRTIRVLRRKCEETKRWPWTETGI